MTSSIALIQRVPKENNDSTTLLWYPCGKFPVLANIMKPTQCQQVAQACQRKARPALEAGVWAAQLRACALANDFALQLRPIKAATSHHNARASGRSKIVA